MNDVIYRQAAIDALRYAQHRFTVADEAGGMGTVKWSEDVIYFAAAKRVLDDLPSAQPDLCDGCDRYGASCVGEGCGKLEISEVAKDTNVLNNDCISRQDAIDALEKMSANYGEIGRREWHPHIEECKSELKMLPSAPERKTGKWIDGKRMKNDGTFYWFRQCDQCGYERNDCDTEKDSNFCPNCGSYNGGEQDEYNH